MRTSLLTLVATSFLVLGCNAEQTESARHLMSSFQNGCSTSGAWTQAALGQNEALASTLQGMKVASACRPYLTSLNAIQKLAERVRELLSEPVFAAYRNQEEVLQELTLELSAKLGTPLAAILAPEVVRAQVTLAIRRMGAQADDERPGHDSIAASTLQLATLMKDMLQQTQGLGSCLSSLPGASVEIASTFLATGGNFSVPIIGASHTVIGELAAYGINAIQNFHENRMIAKLDAATLPQTLGCAMEELTDSYCNATDAYELLRLEEESERTPTPNPLWTGVNLQHQFPVLMGWLRKVRSSVHGLDPAGNSAGAQIFPNVLHAIDGLERMEADAEKRVAYTENLAQQAMGGPQLPKDLLIRAILDETRALLESQGPDNPIRYLVTDPQTAACWLALGRSADCTAASPPPTLEAFVRAQLADQTSFSELRQNEGALFALALDRLNAELPEGSNPDPHATLAAYSESSANEAVSPQAVLKSLVVFLAAIESGPQTPPATRALAQTTRTAIVAAMRALESVAPGSAVTGGNQSPPDSATAKLYEVYQLLGLRPGVAPFGSRLKNLVTWDLRSRFAQGNYPHDPQTVLLSAVHELRQRRIEAGLRDLDGIQLDLNNARSLTKQNVDLFRGYFGGGFSLALHEVDKNGAASGAQPTGADRPDGQVLGRLCVLLLSSGGWEKGWPWQVCSASTLESVYPKPVDQASLPVAQLAKDLEGKSRTDRMCTFHRFRRSGKVEEILRGGSSAAVQ